MHRNDEPPPTYASATSRDPLPLIAPYLPLSSLFPCLLVSRSWHSSFLPYLYSTPHIFFPLGSRTELRSFVLFLRTLQDRADAIPWTHTLSLRSIGESIYASIPSTWLSMLLTRLPSLTHLDVSGFPFFDHASLLAVSAPHENLRVLKAEGCSNLTAEGLSHFLSRLPRLEGVDLSSTPRAATGTEKVFRALARLGRVRELAVRDLQIEDVAPGWREMLRAMGSGLRSLDVRGNLLGTNTVEVLLEYCVPPPAYSDEEVGMEGESGLTQIRIAGNPIPRDAIGKLVRAGRIVTLDLGAGGGIELVPLLSLYSFRSLRTFRSPAGLVMKPNGVKRGVLRALRTLILCSVPEWAPESDVKRLVEFICPPSDTHDKLECIDLEFTTCDSASDSDAGMLNGDFSFFDTAEMEGTRWDTSTNTGERTAEVVATVKRAREREMGRMGKGGKRVRVRVIRDLGGVESREMGSEGERWGLVRVGV